MNKKTTVTGVMAVDMAASCIYHYHSQKRFIKTIYLKKSFYNDYMEWVKRSKGDKYDDTAKYDFFGVQIEKGSPFMLKDMYWDFEPVATND